MGKGKQAVATRTYVLGLNSDQHPDRVFIEALESVFYRVKTFARRADLDLDWNTLDLVFERSRINSEFEEVLILPELFVSVMGTEKEGNNGRG